MYAKIPAEIIISDSFKGKPQISIMIDGPLNEPERDVLERVFQILRKFRDPWVYVTERPWMYDPSNPLYEIAQRLENES